ncbi:MAG TPA: glutaminase A, partial [Halioglobus sp.]
MKQLSPESILLSSNQSSIQSYLEELHRQFASLFEGEIASYIPELTRADPAWFGIALVTVDGHVYQVGDSLQNFTIQSVSKAITYGLALEDNDVDAVLAKVGVEPSGEAFNSISLDKETGRPLNPMINAGAIATTGLIHGSNSDEKLERILRRFEDYVGHPVTIDNEVYESERDTGHRNRAIAHLLRNADIIEGAPEPVVDLYFRQCSINVTAQDLALMGACLANSGVNPITSVVALKSRYVEKVLSVMTTCGMYDYSGSWVYSVGMPAKSGVGGGIMAVLPGQFGLGVFSPLLDFKGNSVRGLRVCEALSRDFDLHLLKVARATSTSVVRVFYDGSSIHSRRRRHLEQRQFLKREGHRIRVYELQGELMFASTDSLIRDVGNNWGKTDFLILDFHRVVDVDAASTRLLASLAHPDMSGGKCLLFTGAGDKYQFRRALRKLLDENQNNQINRFAEADRALEWCEDQLLRDQTAELCDPANTLLERQDLCYQFLSADFDFIYRVGVNKRYTGGEIIFQTGDAGDS